MLCAQTSGGHLAVAAVGCRPVRLLDLDGDGRAGLRKGQRRKK